MQNPKYLGRRTVWERIDDPEGLKAPKHVHSCSTCDARIECSGNCSIHPEHEKEDGVPAGEPRQCMRCQCYKPIGNGIKLYVGASSLPTRLTVIPTYYLVDQSFM